MRAGHWRILKSIVILKLFPWYARHGVKFDRDELSNILRTLYKEGTPHDFEDATGNIEHPILQKFFLGRVAKFNNKNWCQDKMSHDNTDAKERYVSWLTLDTTTSKTTFYNGQPRKNLKTIVS